MTDQVSTGLTPTGDIEHPVLLNLSAHSAGYPDEPSQTPSKDVTNTATDEDLTKQPDDTHLITAEVTETQGGAQVKLMPVPVSSAPALAEAPATNTVPPAIPETDLSDNINRVIAGSPAAEAMQTDRSKAPAASSADTAAAQQQDRAAGADRDVAATADADTADDEVAEETSLQGTAGFGTALAADVSAEQSAPQETTAEEAATGEQEATAEGEGTEAPAAPLPNFITNDAHQQQPPPASLSGQSALLVAPKPSAFLTEVARSLVTQGARVTVAVKHTGDGQMFVKKLQQHLPAEQQQLINCTSCPVNFASQTSVRKFASAVNASDEPLNILLLHTVEAAAASARRWYTPEGAAGTAQLRFLGPATLLHLLTPKLTSDHTSIILTTTPLHRLGQLDDVDDMISSWAGASFPETQLALLVYARQLAEHCKERGLTVAAVDMGPLREQPLAGSLLRKLPPLHQLLHLLLPSAREAAHLLSSIAEDMSAEKHQVTTAASTGDLKDSATFPPESTRKQSGQQDDDTAAASDAELGDDLKYLELMMKHEGDGGDRAQSTHGVGGADASAEGPGPTVDSLGESGSRSYAEAPAGAVDPQEASAKSNLAKEHLQQKVAETRGSGSSASVDGYQHHLHAAKTVKDHSFRYLSRGLLATPLLTAVDLAGRSSWLLHALSNLTAPFYQLAAGTVVRGTMLMDWPVRAWLLAPAGVASGWGKSIMGQRAAQLLAQLQKGVPGVEGVPHTAAPEWVVVKPAGLVMKEKLGSKVWRMVDEMAAGVNMA